MALFGDSLGRSRKAQRKNVVGMFIKGDKALRNMLVNLEPKLFNKVMKGATAKAMTPIGKAARNNVRGASKTVARAMRKRTKTYKKSGTYVTIVGVSNDRKYITTRHQKFGPDKRTVPTKIAHLLEYKVRPHMIPTTRVGEDTVIRRPFRHPGVTGIAFMRKAWDANRAALPARMKAIIGPAIVREARKLAKKGDKSLVKLARKGGLTVDEAV